MLTAVKFYNARGDVLELPMAAAASGAQYVIKNIDGLGPPKADILTASYVGMDGGVYQTSRGSQRNIVAQIGFDPDFAVDDAYGVLRRALYSWLSPRYEVRMEFISDNMETVTITGNVESNEPTIFSIDPMITVSIVCASPNFKALVPVSVTQLYTVPFVMTNPGNVEIGMTYLMNASTWSGSTPMTVVRTEPSVYPEERTANTLNYTGSFYVVGEQLVLKIITVKGKKMAKWAFQSSYIPGAPDEVNFNASLLGYVSSWLNIVPGVNHLAVSLPSDHFGEPMITISFVPEWSGL